MSCSNNLPALGDTPSADAATQGGDFMRPLDTVPSSDGSQFYFTAMGSQGMGVYQVAAAGGMARALATGTPLVSPLGIAISADDKTLFIADAAAGYDPNNPAGADKVGALFTLAASGGSPAVLAGTEGSRPRAVELGSDAGTDTLFFSGQGASDGRPGVFKIPAAGGAVSAVFSGDPLTDPGGVAVARDGTVYVANTTSAQDGTASIYKLKDGAATLVAGDLRSGYPAGIALSQNGGTLLVSGRDRTLGTDVVYRIALDTNTVTQFAMGIENNTDAGGLHRARSADVFSWADLTAGGTGLVYRISFK
jgi:sugar lactone lactonase YvrE